MTLLSFWVGAVLGFFAAVFMIGCRQLAIGEARKRIEYTELDEDEVLKNAGGWNVKTNMEN